jgi:hypothetical protein
MALYSLYLKILVFVRAIQRGVDDIVLFNTNTTAQTILYMSVFHLIIDRYTFSPFTKFRDRCLLDNVSLSKNLSRLSKYFHVSVPKGLVEFDAK